MNADDRIAEERGAWGINEIESASSILGRGHHQANYQTNRMRSILYVPGKISAQLMIINRCIDLMKIALESDELRANAIHDFENLVRNTKQPIGNEVVDEILSTLACDLEFYVPSDSEDPSYFGDDKAKKLIREALRALREAYLGRNSDSNTA